MAWAKDIRVAVLMPEGFTDSRTGTNECELDFFTLHGGDGLGNGLTIRVSNDISPGNYAISLKVSGQNVPEKTLTPEVIVVFQMMACSTYVASNASAPTSHIVRGLSPLSSDLSLLRT